MGNLFGPEPVFDAERAVAAVQGTWWTIQHLACAKAAVDAVLNQDLGPSDDEGTLTLYDLVPEEWCAPDRSAATRLIAENIAFAVLDAWMKAVRAEILIPAKEPSDRCTMGVGCDESGVCYARAHGQPEMCPKGGPHAR